MGLLVSETSILPSRYGLPPHSFSIECLSGLFLLSFLLLFMLILGVCSHHQCVCCIPPSQAYLAFFVIDDLQMNQSAKALVIRSFTLFFLI